MRRRFFDSEATTKQRQSKADHLEAPVQVVMARSVEPDTPVWQGHPSGVDSNAELDTSLKPEKPPSVNPTSARFPFCVVYSPFLPQYVPLQQSFLNTCDMEQTLTEN